MQFVWSTASTGLQSCPLPSAPWQIAWACLLPASPPPAQCLLFRLFCALSDDEFMLWAMWIVWDTARTGLSRCPQPGGPTNSKQTLSQAYHIQEGQRACMAAWRTGSGAVRLLARPKHQVAMLGKLFTPTKAAGHSASSLSRPSAPTLSSSSCPAPTTLCTTCGAAHACQRSSAAGGQAEAPSGHAGQALHANQGCRALCQLSQQAQR